MQKLIPLIPLALVTGLAVLVIGEYRGAVALESTSKAAYVQQVCDDARAEYSGSSEEACGRAQDEAGAEYLCDSTAPSARCWVEVK